MSNVYHVIEQALIVIPKHETVLINQLDKYKESLVYQAPETLKLYENWMPFINILNNNIEKLDEEWKTQLVTIINDSA
jgi:hypothetical protein